MEKKTKKVKEIKAWAVVWEEEAKKAYLVPTGEHILPSPAVHQDIKVEKKIWAYLPVLDSHGYEINTLSIFTRLADARTFREGNKDWKIIPIKITY